MFQALLGALSAKRRQTAGYSMSANTAGCPSKSAACLERLPRQTWVLNSVAKFVYCVQTVCTLAKLGFQVFILRADVCLLPLIPACSGFFCLCQLCLLCFGFVLYVLRKDIAFVAKIRFCFWRIFGRRSDGLKFRSGLPISTLLRCGSAFGGNNQPNEGPVLGG